MAKKTDVCQEWDRKDPESKCLSRRPCRDHDRPHLTLTGRKPSEPALQNIPVRSPEGRKIRKAFMDSGKKQVTVLLVTSKGDKFEYKADKEVIDEIGVIVDGEKFYRYDKSPSSIFPFSYAEARFVEAKAITLRKILGKE